MKYYFKIIVASLLLSSFCQAQNWSLELKSYVTYRTWSLTTKAVSKEIKLPGATIKLFQGSTLVSQVTSDAEGEFTLLVPPNGEFTGEVSYPGCNTKRFSVSTTGVPEKISTDDYKPTFTLYGGFVMVKPYPGIDYSPLKNSLIKVAYLPSLKNFDDVAAAKDAGLEMVGKVYEDEDILFEKFCAKNRAGDAALKIPDCPLARRLYNEAIAIIPNEEYPVEQLKKVGACLKEIEEAEKKAKEAADAKEKARLEKLDRDKTEAARISKENEEKEKANKEKTEKTAADKIASEKANKEKAEADKVAKENAVKEKANSQKTEKEKADAEKLAKKKTKDDEITKAKKKAEEDELAKKKREGEKQDDLLKGKQKGRTDDIIKGKPTGRKDDMVGGKKETTPDDDEMDATGIKKHPVRVTIGVDRYKEYIVKGNDYFKRKRYDEAKTAYEEALKHKPDDAFAIKKIAECKEILDKK